MNANILEQIKKSAAVPSMPQVVSRFLEIMQDPEFQYDDLVKALSTDPGTVSEILRLANSALFGVRNKVVSLTQALTLLGPKRTRSLLLGRYLVDAMSHTKSADIDMSYFWRRSLASSVVASHFAGASIPKLRDETFISALLADIGVPIIAEAMGDRYKPITTHYTPYGQYISADMEIEAVGVTHAEVSAMVLSHWTLPDEVATSVNLHQSTHPGEGDAAAIARVLNASDCIGKLLCEIPKSGNVGYICAGACTFVGIDVGILVDLLPHIEQDIEDLAETLRIDVIPTNVYAMIAKAISEQIGEPAKS